MGLSKETVDYYKTLCDVENHYSWKNTNISVPMSTMQDFLGEFDRLKGLISKQRKMMTEILNAFLDYTKSGNRCAVCGMVLHDGHRDDCKAKELADAVKMMSEEK